MHAFTFTVFIKSTTLRTLKMSSYLSLELNVEFYFVIFEKNTHIDYNNLFGKREPKFIQIICGINIMHVVF